MFRFFVVVVIINVDGNVCVCVVVAINRIFEVVIVTIVIIDVFATVVNDFIILTIHCHRTFKYTLFVNVLAAESLRVGGLRNLVERGRDELAKAFPVRELRRWQHHVPQTHARDIRALRLMQF